MDDDEFIEVHSLSEFIDIPAFPRRIVCEESSLFENIKIAYTPIFNQLAEAVISVCDSDPACLLFMRDQLLAIIQKIICASPEDLSDQLKEILRADMPVEVPVVIFNNKNELILEKSKKNISIKTIEGVPDITIKALKEPGLDLDWEDENNVEAIGE